MSYTTDTGHDGEGNDARTIGDSIVSYVNVACMEIPIDCENSVEHESRPIESERYHHVSGVRDHMVLSNDKIRT